MGFDRIMGVSDCPTDIVHAMDAGQLTVEQLRRLIEWEETLPQTWFVRDDLEFLRHLEQG